MLDCVLRYVARLRADLAFKKFLAVVKDTFNEILATSFARSPSDGMTRSRLLRAHREQLVLFLDMELATTNDGVLATVRIR